MWDNGPGQPCPASPGHDAEAGRGLAIIDHLTGRNWGWWPTPRSGGKVVWAALTAAPVASGDLAARFMSLAPAWPGNEPVISRPATRDHERRAPMPASERSTRDVRQPQR